MMKLMSNDNVDKLKLNNDKFDKEKKSEEKEKKTAFRRGSCLIHYVKVIYISTVFQKHVSSKIIYILI